MLTIPSDGPLHTELKNAVQTGKSFVVQLDTGKTSRSGQYEQFVVTPLYGSDRPILEKLSLDEVRDKIFQSIRDTVAIDENMVLTLDTKLSGVILDSLDLVEITMGLEDEFDIEIDDKIAEKFKCIRDIAGHIFKKLTEPESDELGPDVLAVNDSPFVGRA